MYDWQFQIIWNYIDVLLWGLGHTLLLALFSFVGAWLLSIPLALGKLSEDRLLNVVVSTIVEVMRDLPLIVMLIWMYYCLPFLGLELSPWVTAFIALSLNLSAYAAEVLRAGIRSVPRGQIEAAYATGLSRWHTFAHIVMPQATRTMIPPYLNLLVMVTKFSALASIIAVPELLYQARDIVTNTYRPLEIFTAVAVLYLCLLVPLSLIARYAERRLSEKTKT